MIKNSVKLLDDKEIIRILDYSIDQIMIVDTTGIIYYVNRACEKHYGMTKQELIGKRSVGTAAFQYNPHIRYEVIKAKQRVTQVQHAPNGLELLTTGTPIFDEKENIKYILYNCRDMNTKNTTEISAIRNFKVAENLNEKKEFSFITQNKNVKEILDFIEYIAEVDSTVLLTGESGTGKTLLAKYIHEVSSRHKEKFININCASIPEQLLESELFGYGSGAFSGANKKGKKGLFELADKGTIFLDEISELSLPLQSKLLRVLQDGQFYPVGVTEEKTVNCRIIVATNQDLKKMVQDKTFRSDLYYRINILEINIPPLRERKDDILFMSNYFLSEKEEQYNTINHIISEKAMKLLMDYHWPGNVRQLENCMERLAVTTREQDIEPKHLIFLIDSNVNEGDEQYKYKFSEDVSFDCFIENIESEIINCAYNKWKSSRKVAKALKISDSKAARLIRKYCTET